ncbi:MAG: GNAT family N-acetyltransferase [Burkholderiaceae bacterium]|nr:GNAT family N-acetyltransferase [Burkholderiaceae bacterium]
MQGLRVGLRRATRADAPRAWRWLAQSDLTPRRLGPPLFPDHPPPSYAAFCNDFAPHFFDGSLPYEGRGFVIRCLADGREVGFIVHDRLDVLNDVAGLDLWLAGGASAGRGYGSEAIGLLCNWLQAQRGINRFLLRPSRRNVRALRAMRRAGFRETDLPATQVLDKLALPSGEYADEVLLFRFLSLPPQRLRPRPDQCHVYVDSEFTRLVQPQLLSVGAVADDGTHFYAEIADTLAGTAGGPLDERCSEFVRSVVRPLLDGVAQPRSAVATAFSDWLAQRARHGHVTLVTDSGFDRWALAELLQAEDLPHGVQWLRVPIAYETLDDTATRLGLRRHHALDDARALRAAVIDDDR